MKPRREPPLAECTVIESRYYWLHTSASYRVLHAVNTDGKVICNTSGFGSEYNWLKNNQTPPVVWVRHRTVTPHKCRNCLRILGIK